MHDHYAEFTDLPPLRGIAGMPEGWRPESIPAGNGSASPRFGRSLAPRDLVRVRLHERIRPACVVEVGRSRIRVEVNGALYRLSPEDVISLDQRANGRSLGAPAPVG